MRTFTTIATVGALALTASAQSISIPGVSSGCSTALIQLTFSDLSSCLSVNSLVPLLMAGNDSIVGPIDTYLSGLCSSSPCDESALSSAEGHINSGCASDLEDPASIPNVLLMVLENYTAAETAACLKNETTNTFCVTDMLGTVEDVTQTNVTLSTVTGLLNGDAAAQQQVATALGSGQLCTGCVSNLLHAATALNATAANSTLVTAQGTCGENFGRLLSVDADIPEDNASGVTTATATESSPAATTSPNGAATWSVPPLLVASAALATVLFSATLAF